MVTARIANPATVVHAAAYIPYLGTNTKLRATLAAEAMRKNTGIMRFFLATLDPTQKTKYTA